MRIIGVGLFVLLVVGGLSQCLGGGGGDEDGAIAYCHQFVERELQSPSSADFPSFTDHQVSTLGEAHWRVSSYVDAENAFGASLREDWSCEVTYDEAGETWTLVDLSGL
jgi:hypothetical protein